MVSPTSIDTYFPSAFNERKTVIEKAVATLRPRLNEFDIIVCRGYSGMAIAPIVAYVLDKPLLIVRKSGEYDHSGLAYAGCLGSRYLIIDDFVCSGATVNEILAAVRLAHIRKQEPAPEFVGIYLYEDRLHESSTMGIPLWKPLKCSDTPSPR